MIKTINNKSDSGTRSGRAEARLHCILELSSNYYWEQNSEYRFTFMAQGDPGEGKIDAARIVGKTSWELGGIPVEHGGKWDAHFARLEARLPFRDFLVWRNDPGVGERYLSISGQPVFDENGGFRGYRGITRDVTREKRNERLLNVERMISRILLDAADTHNALQAAIRALCESEGWDSGIYWSLDDDRELMRYYAGWYIESPAIAQLSREARKLTFWSEKDWWAGYG